MEFRVEEHKIIPVAVLNNEAEAEEALYCLSEGGIKSIEITFRTAYAKTAIAYAVKNYPDMVVGAGTVINAEQCEAAIEAGAKFIVGPGFSKSVADCCQKAGVPYIPGVVTPTEIIAALECGLKVLKFFPFGAFGGTATTDALKGPFPDVKFVVTGGVDGDSFVSVLQKPNIVSVGGSWMLKGSKEEKLQKVREARAKIDAL